MKPEPFIGVPGVGVDAVRFGMSRSQVRQHMGSPACSFNRVREAPETDMWHGGCFYVEYDETEQCCAIGVNQPCGLVIQGVNVTSLSPRDAIGRIQSVDPGALEDADGITSRVLGLSLWITVCQSDVDADAVVVASVLLFSSGYGNQL